MKTNKIFMLAFAAGAMVLGSCSNDDELTNEEAAKPATMVFTATMENAGDATRTALSGNTVNWSTGDQITIFNSSDSATFTAENIIGNTCSFSGSIAGSAPYYAVYPAQSGAALSGTTITGVTFPAEQTAVAGSYDPAAALMVATSNTDKLQFKNLNTLIKVTPQFDCSKIILNANGTNIAGTITVNSFTPDGSDAISYTVTNGASIVTLNSPDGSYIQAGQTYYIAILPTTTSASGFMITFIATESDDNGNLGFVKTKSAAVNFYRNQIVNFGNIAKSNCTAVKVLQSNGYAEDYQPDVNVAFVDLGIESNGKMLGWATKNVNASNAKPYGDYYAWGEITPYYDSYTMNGNTVNATFSGDSAYTTIYYNTRAAASISSALSGATQDVATAVMGTNWRMPTLAEIGYLASECVWVYTEGFTHNGLSTKGYKIFRAKDPAHVGYCYANVKSGAGLGITGLHWVKSQRTDYSWKGDGNEKLPSVASDSLSTILSSEYLTKADGYVFLPCSGAFNSTDGAGAFQQGGNLGYYWVSTPIIVNPAGGSKYAKPYYYNFCSYYVIPQQNTQRSYYGFPVRGVCE